MDLLFENEHLKVDNAWYVTAKTDAAKRILRQWLLDQDSDYFEYNDNADRVWFTDNPFSLVDTVDELSAKLDGLPHADGD